MKNSAEGIKYNIDYVEALKKNGKDAVDRFAFEQTREAVKMDEFSKDS